MRHGLILLLLAGVFVGISVALGLRSLGGLCGVVTAVGLVGPGLAYVFGRPGVLGKRADGTIAAWARGLHASYFALCRFGWLTQRGKGPDEVYPKLFVGPRATPIQSLALRQHRSVATLDLTCELPELGTLRRGAYLCVPVLDGTPPTGPQLDAAVAFIDQHIADHNVFVHCAIGRGRSATVAMAWLLARGEVADVEEAVSRLASKRPSICPSAQQTLVVANWHASVRMKPAPADG